MKIGQQYNPFKLFVGALIPNALMRSKELTSSAKLCFGRLVQYAGVDGIAYPSHKTLAEEIGLSERSIERPLKELRDKGFIEVVQPTGQERFQHKTIRYKFLWNYIFAECGVRPAAYSGVRPAAYSGVRPAAESIRYKRISSKRISSKTVARKRDDGKLNPSFGICQSNNGHNPFDINCTNRLIKILQAKRKIMRRVNEDSWICQFQKLRVDDEVEKRKIKSVLIWYGQHIGEEYMIEAFSAESFRKKFDQIANKMNQAQDPKRRKDYKPGDPEDDFKTETTSWITKDGRKRSRVVIDES